MFFSVHQLDSVNFMYRYSVRRNFLPEFKQGHNLWFLAKFNVWKKMVKVCFLWDIDFLRQPFKGQPFIAKSGCSISLGKFIVIKV